MMSNSGHGGHRGRGVRRVLVAAVVLTSVCTGAAAARAVVPATTPGPPAGEHVTTASTTSFTVVMNRASNTTGYRVAASRVESDIYLANINKPSRNRKVTTSKTPTIVSSGWDYRPLTIYYRVATVNGSTVRWSASFHETYLRPPTPSALTAHESDNGTYLSWSSSGADRGYNIQMSTSSAFTSATSFVTQDDTKYFTPYGMARGTTYYFRVRGQNAPWSSTWSNVTTGGTTTRGLPLTVLTYNVLSSHFDGTIENGNKVAPWATRVAGANGVAALISGANPALAAVQEAGGLITVNGVNHPQVADILRLIGSNYAEDCTRSTTNPIGNRYAQNYLIYQPAKLTPVEPFGQACNFWYLDDNPPSGERATYEAFSVNGYTGPDGSPLEFVAVSMHLNPNLGAAADAVRKTEMDNVMADAKRYAASLGISLIVYSGDTNSWPNRVGQTADEPGIEGRVNGIVETNGAAPTHTNQQYESINGYMWTPPHGGSADRTFVTPGIMVASWSEILHLSGGKFAGSYIPSDHNPVVSGIRLPTTSP